MNQVRLISVGFGNFVSAGRIVSIVAPDSAPVKRMVVEAREAGSLIDATCGRRTRAVIITDSGHTVLSSLMTDTVANRFNGKEAAQPAETEGIDDEKK